MVFAKIIKVTIGLTNFSYDYPFPRQDLRAPHYVVDIPHIVSKHYTIPNQPNIPTYCHPHNPSFPFLTFLSLQKLNHFIKLSFKLSNLPTFQPIQSSMSFQTKEATSQSKKRCSIDSENNPQKQHRGEELVMIPLVSSATRVGTLLMKHLQAKAFTFIGTFIFQISLSALSFLSIGP